MTDPIDAILKREGWPAFTVAVSDRGGPTKGGITIRALQDYLGRPVTTEDLQALDEQTARAIYRKLYIEGPGFDKITSDEARNILVDIAVTSGPARSVRWLQAVLGLVQDGNLGNVTATHANAIPGDVLSRRLIAHRCKMIASDVQDNPLQIKWLEGWIARAVEPLEI